MESLVASKIVENIKAKAIENLDEGMLLKPQIAEQFENVAYDFATPFEKFARSGITGSPIKNKAPDRKDAFAFLITQFLNVVPSSYGEFRYYNSADRSYLNKFHNEFREYWREQVEDLKTLLKSAPQFLEPESISEKDLVFINVGYRGFDYEGKGSFHPKLYDTYEVINKGAPYHFWKKADCKGIEAAFIDIFIISSLHFVKLSLGASGVLDRTDIIHRDIKKLNIVNNNLLEIFFHGFYDPEIIVLDDYKSALDLQRHLTNLRQVRYENKNQRQVQAQR